MPSDNPPLTPYEYLVRIRLLGIKEHAGHYRNYANRMAFLSGVLEEAARLVNSRAHSAKSSNTLQSLVYVAAWLQHTAELTGMVPSLDLPRPPPLTAGHFEGYPFDTEPC